MNLRVSLQPTIQQLTKAIDYWSTQTVRGDNEHHYIYLVKTLEDIKHYVLENERNTNEELRLPSRSNGRLHQGAHDQLEDSGVEHFGSSMTLSLIHI